MDLRRNEKRSREAHPIVCIALWVGRSISRLKEPSDGTQSRIDAELHSVVQSLRSCSVGVFGSHISWIREGNWDWIGLTWLLWLLAPQFVEGILICGFALSLKALQLGSSGWIGPVHAQKHILPVRAYPGILLCNQYWGTVCSQCLGLSFVRRCLPFHFCLGYSFSLASSSRDITPQ